MTAINATKTTAQKTSIPRDEAGGRLGSWIMTVALDSDLRRLFNPAVQLLGPECTGGKQVVRSVRPMQRRQK